MRIAIWLVAVSWLSQPAAALSQRASAVQPLAPGEILLEVEAEGVSKVRADVTTVTVPVTATGTDYSVARTANDAALAKLQAAARRAGVAQADMRVKPVSGPLAMIANMPTANFVQTTAASAPPANEDGEGDVATALEELPTNRPRETRQLEIRLRDAASYDRVRTALEKAGATQVGPAVHSLNDDAGARRAAKTAAMAKARAEAQFYATGMNLRVGRVTKISERQPPSPFDFSQYEGLFRTLMGGAGGNADPEIQTRVKLSVDFILVR